MKQREEMPTEGPGPNERARTTESDRNPEKASEMKTKKKDNRERMN